MAGGIRSVVCVAVFLIGAGGVKEGESSPSWSSSTCDGHGLAQGASSRRRGEHEPEVQPCVAVGTDSFRWRRDTCEGPFSHINYPGPADVSSSHVHRRHLVVAVGTVGTVGTVVISDITRDRPSRGDGYINAMNRRKNPLQGGGRGGQENQPPRTGGLNLPPCARPGKGRTACSPDA